MTQAGPLCLCGVKVQQNLVTDDGAKGEELP